MNKDTAELTTEKYWDNLYENKKVNDAKDSTISHKKIRVMVKKIFGKKLFNYLIEPYRDYLFWRICKKFLPKVKGLKILEVGSAPGTRLVEFHQIFGYQPYGVEYSKMGADLNRNIFGMNDINPNNVIHSDFFSDRFQEKYKNCFDIVVSQGFIEHFSGVTSVLDTHVNLLKKGGICLITIPNLRGINNILVYFFNKKAILHHNIKIMDKNNLAKLFEASGLSILYLDYYGTFNWGIFNTEKNLVKYTFLRFCKGSQLILNLLFRLLFTKKRMENKFFSPYLICIGKKI